MITPTRRRRATRRRVTRQRRRGAQAIELVLAFVVTFVFAMSLYAIGQVAFGNLYQVVATMSGSPYA